MCCSRPGSCDMSSVQSSLPRVSAITKEISRLQKRSHLHTHALTVVVVHQKSFTWTNSCTYQA
jgi:hypothetical protein